MLAFKCKPTFPERNEQKGFDEHHEVDLKNKSFSRGVDLLEIVEQMCNIDPAQRPTPKQCKQQVLDLKNRWKAESGSDA